MAFRLNTHPIDPGARRYPCLVRGSRFTSSGPVSAGAEADVIEGCSYDVDEVVELRRYCRVVSVG